MNEHQLRSEAYSLVLHRLKAKRDADYIRDAVVRMAKAYADAMVAETNKDAEILANALLRVVPESHLAIIDKDAEIKRLREGIKKIDDTLKDSSLKASDASIQYYAIIASLIGPEHPTEPIKCPAPVTEGKDYIDLALAYEDKRTDDFKDCHVICDRCDTMFNDGIDSKCPACGCIDFHDPNDEEE